MQITTNGIVIQQKNLGNDNRLLTILTDRHGVIHAFIKAVKSINNRLAASTELFSYSSFVFFCKQDKYTVDKADSNKIFFLIRQDLDKLSLASYMSELMAEIAPENEETTEYLRLLLNCLHMLETGKRSVEFVKPLFELRVMTLAGYMPDLVGCQSCGTFSAQQMCFFPKTGTIICDKCFEMERLGGGILLSEDQLSAMRHIIYSALETLFKFKMSPEGLRALGCITEQYMHAQTGKTFSSLEFYHSLQIK